MNEQNDHDVIQERLTRIEKRVKKNAQMLKSIKRAQWISTGVNIAKFAIIIIPLVLAALYLPRFFEQAQPYLESVQEFNGSVQNINEAQFNDFLEQFRGQE